MIKKGTNKIILDAYNANPSSMKLAIENFSRMPGDKVLILGSMAELGSESETEHRELIDQLTKYPWKNVVLVGKEFNRIGHSYNQFADAQEARDWFKKQKFENMNILIKGSRSMQMEKTIED
jgi:UDP-N-acetylmuramoyl-tripeptide--D-alanyl-D-alanine ligase